MQMQVVIKTLTGTLFPLQVESSDDVHSLKVKYDAAEGLPPDMQRIFFKGVRVQCGRTLGSYGLENGSVLDVVQRLRGGGASLSIADGNKELKFEIIKCECSDHVDLEANRPDREHTQVARPMPDSFWKTLKLMLSFNYWGRTVTTTLRSGTGNANSDAQPRQVATSNTVQNLPWWKSLTLFASFVKWGHIFKTTFRFV